MTAVRDFRDVRADYLVALWHHLGHKNDLIILDGGVVDEQFIALVKTASDFSTLPLRTRFKALVENWNLVRINQEMY